MHCCHMTALIAIHAAERDNVVGLCHSRVPSRTTSRSPLLSTPTPLHPQFDARSVGGAIFLIVTGAQIKEIIGSVSCSQASLPDAA